MSIPCRAAVFFSAAFAAFAQSSLLLDTLSGELDRNFKILKEKADPAPYFISYEVTEQDFQTVGASLGALLTSSAARARQLDVCMRVGAPNLDNYHRVRGERAQFTAGVPVTIEENANAIRQRVWLETDRAYRAAAERLIRIRTNFQVKVADEDSSADFSAEPPSIASELPHKIEFNREDWAARLRRLSLEFHKYPEILTSSVRVVTETDTRYLVSTEGTRLQHGRGFARLMIAAQAKAPDGMDLGATESFDALEPSGLPGDDAVRRAIRKVADDLEGLLRAPVVDPWLGPAIFSGRAAGVFFHEIFGHRIEGHRQKDETEGQTFTRAVGTKVLADFLNVTFDPTRRKINGVDLNGSYDYDDEGVKARSVTVVENGVLRTFLMSRSPIRGFEHSNGHGRRQPGREVVSRQSNLIVESANKVPDKKLREMLIAEVRRQNKPYGLYFDEVAGGLTTTGRAGVQAFKVIPIVVRRVYPDGRPDELVRGADIVGTPLASFAKILATSDRMEIFNGYCGAESGTVPVSAVSPAILVSEIEISKREKGQDRPPLLPEPAAEAGQ